MDQRSDRIWRDINYFATTIASVFTVFTSWRTIKLQAEIFKTRKNIKQIEKNDILEVEEVIGKGRKVNEVVLVKGKVGTKDQKYVQITQKGLFKKSQKQKYAVFLKFTQAMYSNDSYDPKKSTYNLNIKEVLKTARIDGSTKITLFSQDKDKNRTSLAIKNFDQKDYSKVLDIIQWRQQKRTLDLVEHINVLLLSVLQGIVSLGTQYGQQQKHIRGIQVGKRDVEAGIKIGATISILGTIGFTTQGQLFVDANCIFKDRLSELNYLREKIDNLINKRNVWLVFSIAGAIYLLRRAFKFAKKNNIKIPYVTN